MIKPAMEYITEYQGEQCEQDKGGEDRPGHAQYGFSIDRQEFPLRIGEQEFSMAHQIPHYPVGRDQPGERNPTGAHVYDFGHRGLSLSRPFFIRRAML